MTIKDLSALSGYSLGTVSRVLNGHPNVSDAAKEKILSLAAEHGFTLNRNAKHLKQTWTNNLLVVVRGVGNWLFGALVEQLQELAAQGPYQMVVDYVDEEADEVTEAIARIREVKPRGVFFLGSSEEHFRARFGEIAVPAVLVTNTARGLGFANLSSVTTDDEAAACAVIERLLSLGHRHIAVIGGDRIYSDPSRLRYRGCLKAFDARGLAFDERYYETARFSFEGGYSAMEALLGRCGDITAVFAMADVMAIGAARAIRDGGKTVPGDISLVGFDGLPVCHYYTPRLATVCQQAEEIARESYEILLAAVAGESGAVHRQIPWRREDGESVRPIPQKERRET